MEKPAMRIMLGDGDDDIKSGGGDGAEYAIIPVP